MQEGIYKITRYLLSATRQCIQFAVKIVKGHFCMSSRKSRRLAASFSEGEMYDHGTYDYGSDYGRGNSRRQMPWSIQRCSSPLTKVGELMLIIRIIVSRARYANANRAHRAIVNSSLLRIHITNLMIPRARAYLIAWGKKKKKKK